MWWTFNMQQDFGCLIYLALPSTRLRTGTGVFASKFTVTSRQEYEVQFARIGCPTPQSVFRRYRQFHQLSRAVAALGITEPSEARFPAKQTLRSLKAEVVSYRRTQLEQWLRSVAGTLVCHTFVYEFLGVGGVDALQVTGIGRAELLLTSALHRLLSEPQMKLAALETFDRQFFPQTHDLHRDFLSVLLIFLLPLLGDQHAGHRALLVMRKLMSRSQFIGSGAVLLQLAGMDSDLVRKARLELHLVNDREEACEVFQVLYEERITRGREELLELVLATQVNGSAEALDSFEGWYRRQADQESLSPVLSASQWRILSDPGKSDLGLKLRAVGKAIECEAQILVYASLPRVVDLILKPELRVLWDFRFPCCTVTPTESPLNYKFEISFEANGLVQTLVGILRVVQESDSKVTMSFETPSGEMRSSYEITTQRRSSTSETRVLPLSSQVLPQFSDECSGDWSTPRFNDLLPEPESDLCQVIVRNFGKESVARLFVPDLLGESQVLLSTWQRFKALAEGSTAEEAQGPDQSLSEALDRKWLGHLSGRKEDSAAQLLGHRKLERRMFMP